MPDVVAHGKQSSTALKGRVAGEEGYGRVSIPRWEAASAENRHPLVLRCPKLREYDKVAQQRAAEGVDFPRYLLRLTELELLDERRVRQAKFEVIRSLDSFEFPAIPSFK
jgi:hypothetical protein